MPWYEAAMGMMLLQRGMRLETQPVLRPDQMADAQYWAFGPGAESQSWGCDASHRDRNFSWWSQTWAAGFTALAGEPAYTDPAIKTVDGVFVWDAEYCSLGGFLDLPKALLNNYSAVMAVEEAACAQEPLKTLKLQGLPLSAVFEEVDLAFEIQRQKPPAQREAPLQKEGVLDRVSAYHCARGSYSCMVHFCLHNFCRVGDRIAQGRQCRSDFGLLPRSVTPPK
ncbi:unnamed protein product [Effrenium voratum]|nr:unnamed protein product [Effrenium voratum]